MVDLAAMRDAVAKQGFDPSLVNPKCPTDLIVDHSLQIDYSKWCVCIKSLYMQFTSHTFHDHIDDHISPGHSDPAVCYRL